MADFADISSFLAICPVRVDRLAFSGDFWFVSSKYTRPAEKRTDERLFDRTSRGLQRLQKQARKELRQKGRDEFWRDKLLREEEEE